MKKNEINKRKQRIIDAAISVIEEKSIEEATIREIAKRAGLTSGAIYHHYKNKDELFFDVVNHSIHFSYKYIHNITNSEVVSSELLHNLQNEVIFRLSKLDEQKLHISLLSDVISKDGELKNKYEKNYENIINNVADLYSPTFGIDNEKQKKYIAMIFIAALDGIAIQNSLGIIPEDQNEFIKSFNEFFTESIPAFLENKK